MDTLALAAKHCVPCRGGVAPLTGYPVATLLRQLKNWRVVMEEQQEHHLSKIFVFPDFAQALTFVNRVGAVAEAEGHHPDVFLSWGKVQVDIWTHKINGLSESDFILAAKIDALT